MTKLSRPAQVSTRSKSRSSPAPDPRSIGDHLGELRGRLTWVILSLLVLSAIAYNFHKQLVAIVLAPIGGQQLIYLTPAGGFTFIFQIVLYTGLLLTVPVIIYHLYRFVAPALPSHMRRMSLGIVLFSSFMMTLGVSFGYFVAIPAALNFLANFAGDFVLASLTADSYLNFVVAYLLGLGLLFQLPLLLVLWNWVSPLKPGGLLNTQRFVLVGAFVAAAVITPTPDIFNQSLIAVPIVIVYQFGVLTVYLINRKARKTVSRYERNNRMRQQFLNSTPWLGEPVNASIRPKPAIASASVIPLKTNPVASKSTSSPSNNVVYEIKRARSPSVGVPERLVPSRRQLTTIRSTSVVQKNVTSIDGFSFV